MYLPYKHVLLFRSYVNLHFHAGVHILQDNLPPWWGGGEGRGGILLRLSKTKMELPHFDFDLSEIYLFILLTIIYIFQSTKYKLISFFNDHEL